MKRYIRLSVIAVSIGWGDGKIQINEAIKKKYAKHVLNKGLGLFSQAAYEKYIEGNVTKCVF